MKVLFALVLCLSFALPFAAQGDDRPIVARITAPTTADRLRAVQLGLDLLEYREGDELIFITTRTQVEDLRNAGWSVRIDKKLTSELADDSLDTFNGGYRTVEETYAFLNQMQATYPNLARAFTYGESWQKEQNAANGYDLVGISLTNRAVRGVNKPRFFLQAGIHARELVPPEIATRFISYLLTNYGIDADATWLLNEHEIVVIPIINPDGRKLAESPATAFKRKNHNTTTGGCSQETFGIDLNRNFSFLWGTINLPSDPPCEQTWPGLSAASEPEASEVEDLLNSLYPDQRLPHPTSPAPLNATGVYLDMHSTGNLILYPWGENETPPPNPQLATIAEKMAGYNGYDPIQSVYLYPTSGTAREYAYGELGVAGLAMEIGVGFGDPEDCEGFAPLFSCLDGGPNGNFWNLNLPGLLYLAKIARTPYMTSDGPTAETLTFTQINANTFTIRSQLSDQLNGGQNVAGARTYVNGTPWRGARANTAMTAEDGSFNSPVEFATATLVLPVGRSIIYVQGRDTAQNEGAVKAVFINVQAAGSTQ